MSIDQETTRLTEDIYKGNIEKRYLESHQWDQVDPEKLAQYLVLTREHFNSIKKVIQFVSGCMILLENQSLKSDKEVFHALLSAKNILEKTNHEIGELPIREEWKGHHQHLLDSLSFLNAIFSKFVLTERVLSLDENQSDQLIYLLKHANEKLKKAASFEMGLGMVSLDSSCACGH